ncbi:Metallo-hydrolase/oxidoreductase [Wolfiporia cocos MD-104 SS10]|uniref:Metallo-hydrolase/oxidoreductase n=1 Tax=Wolfiporia cocos (strain MD-104) TaxID=742152 RepID=A0A2H3JJG5_WOLCO|nr:Metallo-hydrolase/oxidoreductase [Wolfiporia cocos MD-104 SS10]
MSLPRPAENQAYCTVSALETGFVNAPLAQFIDHPREDEILRFPCLSFLLRHSTSQELLMFDLGVPKDWEKDLPPVYHKMFERGQFSIEVPQDASESLQKGGYDPAQIAYVCLSHLHLDHHGDHRPFTNATFIVGEETRALIESGYPTNPDSHFRQDLLPHERTRYLSTTDMQPVGPFPRALDFYGDGSLYLVDTPGHFPGHLCLLARTSPDGGWIFLAGDAAHDYRLISGKARIGDSVRYGCMHQDKAIAEETIRRIGALAELPKVQIILAHDKLWYDKHAGSAAFLPGSIDSL